jgi:hypothetical protein
MIAHNLKMALPCLLLATILLPLGAFASAAQSSVVLPDFSYTQGWLGADDAYSVPLGPHETLWLFGDTFVGDENTTHRSDAKTMVRNSVGISTCVPNKTCSMRYYWLDATSPKPRSFFDSGIDNLWYWPLDAVVDGDTLYVALLAVVNKPKSSPTDVFGFDIAGTKLAIVKNVHASPEKWHPAIRDLTGKGLWTGISIVHDGNHLLWYTQVSSGEGHGYMAVARTGDHKISTSPSAWQYLASDGQWKSGFPAADARHVIDQAISEMSVRLHPSIQKWIALSIGPEFPSPRVVYRTADSPIGPWSAPQTIYEFPEMKLSTPGFDKETFCYAAKEHTEFTDTQIAMTYACNSMSIPKVKANMQIYRPQVVILDVPK